VLPVAANTFERTPGNRACDASRAPLDTVYGTADRAMVVPPMSGDARPVKSIPAPTQTTTTRAALVMANTENGVPGPTGEQPAQTLRTEGALAMITPTGHEGANGQRTNDAGRPTSNLTTAGDRALGGGGAAPRHASPGRRAGAHRPRRRGQHHGVVVAHYDPGWARDAGQQPIGSITTRDGHSLIVPCQSACGAAPAAERPTGSLTSSDRVALLVPAVAGGESSEPEPERGPGRAGTGTPWRSGVLTEEDIDACLFRMFALHEIAGAMAMRQHLDGAEYVVLGNKRERMRLMGNAVTPPAMALIVGRLLEVLG
jgi:DNA (cytosine-5)-methyltransferase 1